MKNKRFKLVMSILGIVMTLSLTLTLVFGWKIFIAEVNSITLKVIKIDSEVYLYQAIDSNYNGVPDLLSEYSSDEIATIQTGYPENKKEYYTENKAFSYLGYRYALSSDSSTDEYLTFDLDEIYPTQIKTLKFSAINNSDGTNYASFAFDSKTYDTTREVDLLKCMSVRVGKVVNNTCNTSTPDLTSSDISVEYTDKYYFADHITTISTAFNVLASEDAYEIKGSVTKDSTKNDDVLDLWFQFEMESYDTLSLNSNFDLTEDEYQALQGQSITLPNLKLTLEIRVDD